MAVSFEREFASKLYDHGGMRFHAKALGITCDGATNDLAAVNAAILDLATNHTRAVLEFPEGVINVTGGPVVPRPGVSIVGVDPEATILDFNDHDDHGIRGEGTALAPLDDLFFGNFSIRNVASTGTNERHAFLLEGLVRRCHIFRYFAFDVDDSGLRISNAGGTGLEPEDNSVLMCVVKGAHNPNGGQGFEFQRAHRTKIAQCVAEDITGHGFRFNGGEGLQADQLEALDCTSRGFYFGGAGTSGTPGVIETLSRFVATNLSAKGFGVAGIYLPNGCKRGVISGFQCDGEDALNTTGVSSTTANGETLATDANSPNEDILITNGQVYNCVEGVFLYDEQYRIKVAHCDIVMAGTNSQRAFRTDDNENIMRHITLENNRVIASAASKIAWHHTDDNASTYVWRRWNTAIMNSASADVRSGSAGTLVTQFNAVETNVAVSY